MSLLPDPAELLARADRISAHAVAARARARSLGDAVAATRWQGSAAHAFDVGAAGVLAGLRHSAARLDDAADALRRHAHRVDDVLAAASRLGPDLLGTGDDLVSALRHGLTSPEELLDDAAHLGNHLGALAGDVGQAMDGVLGGVGAALGLG